jgi:hypothetical protein
MCCERPLGLGLPQWDRLTVPAGSTPLAQVQPRGSQGGAWQGIRQGHQRLPVVCPCIFGGFTHSSCKDSLFLWDLLLSASEWEHKPCKSSLDREGSD